MREIGELPFCPGEAQRPSPCVIAHHAEREARCADAASCLGRSEAVATGLVWPRPSRDNGAAPSHAGPGEGKGDGRSAALLRLGVFGGKGL